jgi:hypothetical protein
MSEEQKFYTLNRRTVKRTSFDDVPRRVPVVVGEWVAPTADDKSEYFAQYEPNHRHVRDFMLASASHVPLTAEVVTIVMAYYTCTYVIFFCNPPCFTVLIYSTTQQPDLSSTGSRRRV